MGLDRLPYPQDVRWAGAGSTFRRRLQRWETEVVGGSGAAAAAAPGGGGGGGAMFSPRDGAEGLQHGGDGGVLGAVLRGVAGLAAEPIRGLDEGEVGGEGMTTGWGEREGEGKRGASACCRHAPRAVMPLHAPSPCHGVPSRGQPSTL